VPEIVLIQLIELFPQTAVGAGVILPTNCYSLLTSSRFLL